MHVFNNAMQVMYNKHTFSKIINNTVKGCIKDEKLTSKTIQFSNPAVLIPLRDNSDDIILAKTQFIIIMPFKI